MDFKKIVDVKEENKENAFNHSSTTVSSTSIQEANAIMILSVHSIFL